MRMLRYMLLCAIAATVRGDMMNSAPYTYGGRVVVQPRHTITDYPVTVLAGQSNADGRPTTANTNTRPIRYSLLLNYRGRIWQDLDQRAATDWGLEIALGKNATNAMIFKVAEGGTGLQSDWHPTNNSSFVNMWAALTSGWARAQYNAQYHQHRRLVLTNIVWVQGESDAASNEFAIVYAANLSNFSLSARAALGNTNANFIIARTRLGLHTGNFPYAGIVWTQQENYVGWNTRKFLTDDLAVDAAATHYTDASLEIMGYRAWTNF